MNKIFISGITASCLLISTVNAKTIDEKLIQLESIIKAQQKQIDQLKNIIELKASNDDLEELDERLEGVETKTLTDKIQLGLGMRVEMNNYSNTYANDEKFDANEIYRTKLNINMKSKITDKMKFTGRLSMYKNWGDSTPRNTNYDSMQGRKPDNSTTYIERAYIDWILNDKNAKIPFVLTLGRQPSSDGPSYQIKEDMRRKGTYDALATDGAADGFVLTSNLNNLLDGVSFRIAYGTPNVFDNQQNTSTQFNYTGTPNANKTIVIGYFLEKEFSNLNCQNLSQLYYIDANDMNGNPQLLDDKTLGDMDLFGAMFEASNIKKRVDIFAHYAYNRIKPNGQTVDLSNIGGSSTTGLLTDNGNTKEVSGDAYWLGARYNINSDYKLGVEYNHGSKNWFSFTSGANDPLNKLATRGDAIEAYITKEVNKYANLRVGYVDINYDYTGSGSHLGEPQKITDSLGTNAIKETSNLYVNFNLLF